ncbi:hypothetical protein LTR04_007315 [Oleoguttula sp. CCFEE 6159]|nr:hypothetical protein LTR04_007315 [Oleoguttula sp. CCFEE 6159]
MDGPIKALQFNPFRNELLATAGAKGELFISDTNNIANPFRLGQSAARADDFECLDWNKKVPHILVTGSSGGFVTVWDVKSKKESLTLNNLGRKAVSAVAWDPDVPTKLVTAIPNDQDPLILMWDLRNSNAPERTLRGHDLGVLSLSWCQQDTDLLLSCGKDNRTICWNPRTGESYGDFPVVTNWTFQTRWNPHNPGLLATASFDGKISVQTIQNTNAKENTDAATASHSLDGEDFFSKAQTQPQGVTFSLPKAPRWLERPVGVSFGFGGKVVKLSTDLRSRKSTISISTFAVDSAISGVTEKFEEAVKGGDLASICESKIQESKTEEEKADWQVIETLIAGNSRMKLVEYLGLSDTVEEAPPKASDKGLNNDNGKEDVAQTNGSKDDSSFFDSSADSENFLADLAATKGAKTNNPFKIYTGSESDADKDITRALMLGRFEKALDVCLRENRMSDAFMIAICGGQKCIDKAQTAYLKKKAHGPNYLRLLASIVGKNLWDVVHNADLGNWREAMATLCAFADGTEFADLCEALGDRLGESLQEASEPGTLRRDASFCYLAGSKLEKVVSIWIQELQESETAGMKEAESESSFSVHAKSLRDFIEKVTIFRQVTKFQDSDRQQTSGWKLAPLYAKYTEYADILAAHGQLQIAEKYLDLLPDKYPAAEAAKERVKQATGRAASQVTQQQPAAATRAVQRARPAVQGFQPAQAPTVPAKATNASLYAPINLPTSAPQPPQSQPVPGARGPYAPAGYQQPQQLPQPPNQFSQQSPYGMGYQQPQQQPLPPPPRASAASPAVPPPSRAANMSNWNDMPENFIKPPTSRRGTPGLGAPAVNSPFPNQSNYISAPPPLGPPYAQQVATPPLPPPPKAGQAPPRVTSPLAGPGQYEGQRPSSSAANAYAPQHPTQSLSTPQQTPVLRGPSPYNAPLSAAPPSNRYAPAPSSQPAPQNQASIPPPRQSAPPPNPYVSHQNSFAPQQGARNPSVPSPQQSQGYSQGPPQGPPQLSSQGLPQGPPQGPPRVMPQAPVSSPPPRAVPDSRPSTAQSQRASTPAVSKYPPGDRSHISSNAQPIYEILNADMQRIKARAPASFKVQVNDTEKRLNMLFDHLNNEDLLKPNTVAEMNELAQALQGRQYDQALGLLTEMMKTKLESEGGNWMVGVKRLIAMSRATPN